MKNQPFLSLCCLFTFFLITCQTPVDSLENKISKEVELLLDKKLQRAFLEKIAASDQTVRDEESAINQKYGYNSEEHQQAAKVMANTDKSNLLKIEAYLEKYGHPNKLDHGNRAFYAPWIVMHHAPKDSGTRKRNFKYLYDYYKKEELEQDRLNFFLGRMHQLEFGGRIQWNRSFTVQEEFDSLINVLDLRTVANEIDRHY